MEGEDGAQSSRVKDIGFAEIQDETPDTRVYLLLHDGLEVGCVAEIQRGTDPDYHGILSCLLNRKVHDGCVRDPFYCMVPNGTYPSQSVAFEQTKAQKGSYHPLHKGILLRKKRMLQYITPHANARYSGLFVSIPGLGRVSGP